MRLILFFIKIFFLSLLGYVFGGDVLRFFHGGDECLTIPSTWNEASGQKYKFIKHLFSYIYEYFYLNYTNFSIVVYEGGSVMSQARSLWRLELARTKWSGAFINWYHPMRIRHLTTGRYLGVNENNELHLVTRYNFSS